MTDENYRKEMQVDVKVLNESNEGDEDNDCKWQKLEEIENIEKEKGRIIMVVKLTFISIYFIGYWSWCLWYWLGLVINSYARSFEINSTLLGTFIIKLKWI